MELESKDKPVLVLDEKKPKKTEGSDETTSSDDRKGCSMGCLLATLIILVIIGFATRSTLMEFFGEDNSSSVTKTDPLPVVVDWSQGSTLISFDPQLKSTSVSEPVIGFKTYGRKYTCKTVPRHEFIMREFDKNGKFLKETLVGMNQHYESMIRHYKVGFLEFESPDGSPITVELQLRKY